MLPDEVSFAVTTSARPSALRSATASATGLLDWMSYWCRAAKPPWPSPSSGEVDVRPLADRPFVDHLPRADVPEPDAIRDPPAARRPPAVPAQGSDLPPRM